MPNGKIDFAALPDPSSRTAALALPMEDEREEQVAQSWRSVLGHGGFGRLDRFFTVGGDSIRAIQVIGLLRAAGHAVEMRAFLAEPTVAGLARLLIPASEAPPEPSSARVDLSSVAELFDER
jgi:aryl carrier-like protein